MSFLKSIWKNNSKHQKLCEEWALANSLREINNIDNDNDFDEEVTFLVKYLGSTLIDSPRSEQATAEAVTAVIQMAKAGGKKLPRVALNVSLRGIEMANAITGEQLLEVSIYRISYCSADAAHDHVFAFIATNDNETMECHAMLCPKRKMAQAVTLTVARSFNAAYQVWQAQEDQRLHEPRKCKKQEKDVNINSIKGSTRSLLIDFTAELPSKRCGNDNYSHNTWVSFEDDQLDQDNGNTINLWADSKMICS